MTPLELRAKLIKHVQQWSGPFKNSSSHKARTKIFHRALEDIETQDILGLKVPEFENVIECDGGGTVRAIRLDGFDQDGNLKDPIVAGLVLLNVLKGRITLETKGIIRCWKCEYRRCTWEKLDSGLVWACTT